MDNDGLGSTYNKSAFIKKTFDQIYKDRERAMRRKKGKSYTEFALTRNLRAGGTNLQNSKYFFSKRNRHQKID
jgi:hypothetical protein